MLGSTLLCKTRMNLSPSRFLPPLGGLLLALCASCGGGVSGAVVEEPERFPGYPNQTNLESVWAEAIFFTDHERIFGTDLTRDGILPVALHLGTRGPEKGVWRVSEETFDPHLYLQDGTALQWIPYDSVGLRSKRIHDRVASLALRMSLLLDWDAAEPRFVFFAFDEERILIDGTRAIRVQSRGGQELDLLHSLAGFSVEGEDEAEQLFVGLTAGRWGEQGR